MASQSTSRRPWLLLAGVTLLLALAAGAYGGYWVWRNLGAELLLRNQQAKVTIPEPMPVGIDILDELDVELDTLLTTTVPIDQTLTLPIEDTLNVEVTFDSRVPIRMTVPIRQTIRLDQTIAVDGTVSVKTFGRWVELPLKGDLPVQADIPLDVEVAVDQQVNLAFTAPAQVTLLDDLEVPLKTNIQTRIPLRTALSVPVRSRMRAYATILEPADALIAELDLKLPIREIGFSIQRNDQETAAPVATDKAEP
ncbi:MAG: hypothetical protein R3276_11130 [Marinobacter sp.]|nr:hypothetical protein [Marinobacter sp.]